MLHLPLNVERLRQTKEETFEIVLSTSLWEVQQPLAQLVLHRARLATALCETGLVPLLLDLEGCL